MASDDNNLTLYQVDSFTDQAFKGNPAAVCVLEKPESPYFMQQLAMEMNLSETAYLVQQGYLWHLRWFTPRVEVDLCGHATLAAAHILWEKGLADPKQPLKFGTRSGVLIATHKGDWIEMDFPSQAVSPAEPPPGLIEAMGVKPTFVGRGPTDYLIEVATEAEVRAARPNITALEQVEARGIILTAQAKAPSEYDFISRFFAPSAGVPEDPVTGSAHCALAPYWLPRLGADQLLGYQASHRGGFVKVAMAGDRVRLGGQALTVMVSHLRSAAL